jgi:hypothetical protein
VEHRVSFRGSLHRPGGGAIMKYSISFSEIH